MGNFGSLSQTDKNIYTSFSLQPEGTNNILSVLINPSSKDLVYKQLLGLVFSLSRAFQVEDTDLLPYNAVAFQVPNEKEEHSKKVDVTLHFLVRLLPFVNIHHPLSQIEDNVVQTLKNSAKITSELGERWKSSAIKRHCTLTKVSNLGDIDSCTSFMSQLEEDNIMKGNWNSQLMSFLNYIQKKRDHNANTMDQDEMGQGWMNLQSFEEKKKPPANEKKTPAKKKNDANRASDESSNVPSENEHDQFEADDNNEVEQNTRRNDDDYQESQKGGYGFSFSD